MNSFEDSVLRVLKGDAVVGAAFLVTNSLIATCAHVIKSAGADFEERTSLRLPDGKKVDAVIEPKYWRNPNAEDIAILRLVEPLKGVEPVILGSSTNTRGHTFSTMGFPKKSQELSGGGEIIGRAIIDRIEVLQLRSPEVTPGFSGSPIFDEEAKYVVGMIVAITPPDEYQRLNTTAFAIPSETLQAVCSELRIQLLTTDTEKYLSRIIQKFSEWERKYTPLKLTHQIRLTKWVGRFGSKEAEHSHSEGLIFSDAVAKHDRLIILGEPGSGKTTSLNRLALEYALNARKKLSTQTPDTEVFIPIFVELGRYSQVHRAQREAYAPGEEILLLVMDALRSAWGYSSKELGTSDVHQMLESGKYLFLFDGLNEVRLEFISECCRSLRDFIENLYPAHKFIITSRKHNYLDRFKGSYETLEILDLSLDEIGQYITRYLNARASRELVSSMSPQVRRIAQNPLMLHFIIKVYQSNRSLPHNRAMLIDEVVRQNLWRERAKDEQPKSESFSLETKMVVATHLAYAMQKEGLILSEVKVLEILQTALRNLSIESNNRILLDELCDSHILQQEDENIEFWHQSIQEYFVARRVASDCKAYFGKGKEASTRRQVVEYIKDPAWHEVLALATGMLEEHEVTYLIKVIQRNNIVLAAMCLGNSQSIPSPIEAAFTQMLLTRARFGIFFPSTAMDWLMLIVAILIGIVGISYFGEFQVVRQLLQISFTWTRALYGLIKLSPAFIIQVITMVIGWSIIGIFLFLSYFPIMEKVMVYIGNLLTKSLVLPSLIALRHINSPNTRNSLAILHSEVITNPWVSYQIKAVIQMTRMIRMDTEEELLAALKNKNTQAYAIEILADVASTKTVDLLLGFIHKQESQIGGLAILTLGQVAARQGIRRTEIVKELHGILSNSESYSFGKRRCAHKALAQLGIHERTPFITFQDIIRSITWLMNRLFVK